MTDLKSRLLCLALAAALALPAAFAEQPQAATPAAQPARHALLWKVSDADNSVYLLGSFHLLRAADNPISPAVEAAFSDAEQIVFELTPAELSAPGNAAKFTAAAKFDDGRTLSQVLEEGTQGES